MRPQKTIVKINKSQISKIQVFTKRKTRKLTNLQLDSLRKRERTHINEVKNEIIDTTGIHRIIRDYYEQLYVNLSENLEEMDEVLDT